MELSSEDDWSLTGWLRGGHTVGISSFNIFIIMEPKIELEQPHRKAFENLVKKQEKEREDMINEAHGEALEENAEIDEQKDNLKIDQNRQELFELVSKKISSMKDSRAFASRIIFDFKKEIGDRTYFGEYGGVSIDGIKVMIEESLSGPARTVTVPLQYINIESLGIERMR